MAIVDGLATIFNMAKRPPFDKRRSAHRSPGPRGGRGAAKKVWDEIYVKEIRELRGWKMHELAERADLSGPMVSGIENKKSAGSPDSLQKIAAALEIKLGELFEKPRAGSRLLRVWVPTNRFDEIARVIAAMAPSDR